MIERTRRVGVVALAALAHALASGCAGGATSPAAANSAGDVTRAGSGALVGDAAPAGPDAGGDGGGDAAERADDASPAGDAEDGAADDADAYGSDSAVGDSADLDATGPDATGPDATVPDATVPDAAGPDATGDDDADDDTSTSDAPGQDAAASDSSGDAGAPFVKPPLWDEALVKDAADAKCTFTEPHTVFDDGVSLDAWSLTYISYESIDGTLQPILIRGFAARPKGGGARPGVVQAHGLGGFAKESHATGLAALTGAFVVAYTGPGGGDAPNNTSEGLPSGAKGGLRMFDVEPDIRGSWFWGHAMAARRALTCLAARPDVIASKLGVTGFSAGGVTSFLVGGSDDRVSAAVPLSGVLAWDVATLSPLAWQHNLLKQAGLTTASSRWQKLMSELIAPAKALAAAKGKLFLVNGSSDEFFPLTAGDSTWLAWPGPRWQSVVGNFDHGVFQVYGAALPGGAAAIEAAASLRAKGAQRALFHHVFGTDSRYVTLPQPPELQVTLGQIIAVAAAPMPAPAALQLESMRFWYSLDNAQTWLHADLDKSPAGWTKLLPGPAPPHVVWYVDATYKTKDLLPQRFSVSSRPHLPAGWVPTIWGMP